MRRQDLEELILDYIKNLYSAEYVGELSVYKIGEMYTFSIAIPEKLIPTTISCNCETDEDFLTFIYEEIRTRNYMRVYFYEVRRTKIYKDN